MNAPLEPRLRDVEWAALYLGLTKRKTYELVESFQLRPIRLGRRMYFTRELLEEFIARCTVGESKIHEAAS